MLHQVVKYAEHQLPDSEPGFTTREVRWCLEISIEGEFCNVIPLGDGKRGQAQSRCPDMHGMNAGGKAHFLVETAQTVALLFKPKEESKKINDTKVKHDFFVSMLRDAANEVPSLAPLARLLQDEPQLDRIRQALSEQKAKPSDWIGWRVNGPDPREDKTVQNWWREWRRKDLLEAQRDGGGCATVQAADAMLCLLTGEAELPLATHPKIKGLSGVGGLGTGDVVVGFDKAAFGSYNLEQSANASMSAESAQKYVDGLNDLIRNHSRKLGNALVAHWFKQQILPENDPLDFLYSFENEEQQEAAALGEVRKLLSAIHAGARVDLGNNHYYAVTLSGASGRVMVRDWMEGTFENLLRNIEAWFADLAIVARDGTRCAPDPKFLALCGSLVRDLGDLPAPLSATLWKVAVQRLPIPQSVMAQALTRFRVDLVDKDQPAFNHARMGLIKAYFVRLNTGGDSAMTAYLNSDHPSPAYHCGRLLALLANLQRAALGDVGAGVVQRYYAAASQTPGLVLGRLVSNSRNHLGKLDGGLAYWYENQIADVMTHLRDGAPRILDLEGQGLFALGYYQQIAALRAGKKMTNATNEQETV